MQSGLPNSNCHVTVDVSLSTASPEVLVSNSDKYEFSLNSYIYHFISVSISKGLRIFTLSFLRFIIYIFELNFGHMHLITEIVFHKKVAPAFHTKIKGE